MEPIERLEKATSAIQHLVFALAALIGGIWAYYQFDVLLSVENARAELAKLERSLQQQAALELSLDVQRLDAETADQRIVVGTIIIKNTGNRNTTIDLVAPPIRLSRLRSLGDREIEFAEPRKAHLMAYGEETIDSKISLAGSTDRMSFAAAVPEAGVYYVTFSARRTPAETEVARHAGALAPETLWHTGTFVYVR